MECVILTVKDFRKKSMNKSDEGSKNSAQEMKYIERPYRDSHGVPLIYIFLQI